MAKQVKTFPELFAERVKKEKLTLTQQFKLLTVRKKQLEALQTEVGELLDTCQEAIFAEWEAQGVAKVSLDTGETVFLHAQYWAKAAPIYVRDKNGEIVYDKKTKEPLIEVDPVTGEPAYYSKDDIIKALKSSGHGDIVSEGYNVQTLSSIIREILAKNEELPDPLAKVLVAEPTYSVRIRGLKVIKETILDEEVAVPY